VLNRRVPSDFVRAWWFKENCLFCADTVMLLDTAGTQCVETWLGENTIPLIILNCSICLRMYKHWNR